MSTPTEKAKTEDVKCPFCGDDGFDLIGLKGHLEHGDCEAYENIQVPRRLF